MRAGQLRPLVPAHQTSSALINGHHPGTHQEPARIDTSSRSRRECACSPHALEATRLGVTQGNASRNFGRFGRVQTSRSGSHHRSNGPCPCGTMPAGALALVPQSRFHVLEQLGGNVEEFNGTRQA